MKITEIVQAFLRKYLVLFLMLCVGYLLIANTDEVKADKAYICHEIEDIQISYKVIPHQEHESEVLDKLIQQKPDGYTQEVYERIRSLNQICKNGVPK